MLVVLCVVKICVSAGNHQGNERKGGWGLLEKDGQDVTLKMIDCHQWFFASVGYRLGDSDTYQQSTHQSWSSRDGDGIYSGQVQLCLLQCLLDHRDNHLKVLSGGKFRYHPAIRLMNHYLRGNCARHNLPPILDHSCSSLITRAFNSEYNH